MRAGAVRHCRCAQVRCPPEHKEMYLCFFLKHNAGRTLVGLSKRGRRGAGLRPHYGTLAGRAERGWGGGGWDGGWGVAGVHACACTYISNMLHSKQAALETRL